MANVYAFAVENRLTDGLMTLEYAQKYSASLHDQGRSEDADRIAPEIRTLQDALKRDAFELARLKLAIIADDDNKTTEDELNGQSFDSIFVPLESHLETLRQYRTAMDGVLAECPDVMTQSALDVLKGFARTEVMDELDNTVAEIFA